MNEKRLMRSKTNRMLAGVCGGLAEYLKLDYSLVRIAAVVGFIITGFFPVAVIYLVMWAVVPED